MSAKDFARGTMSHTDRNQVVELLQRAVAQGFYGEVSFVFQDSKVVLIREEKTTKQEAKP